MNLFAQSQAVDVANWIGALGQLGATGIMGYFLLFVLPKMHATQMETQLNIVKMFHEISGEDRKAFEERNKLLATELHELVAAFKAKT